MLNQTERLRQEIERNLRLYFFESAEIEEVFKDIDSLDRRLRRKTLALCLTLSGISANLVPRTLGYIKAASSCMPAKDMERWLSHAFDLLDSKGLEAAIGFLSKTDEACLISFAAPEGLRLDAVKTVLETYIRGLSGMDFRIAQAEEAFTDTQGIWLPESIASFKENEKNFLLYKLMVVHNWALIKYNSLTFSLDPKKIQNIFKLPETQKTDIERLFSRLPDKEFALQIYSLLEAIRLEGFLEKELPGLMKEAKEIKARLFDARPHLSTLSGRALVLEALYQRYLAGKTKGTPPALIKKILKKTALKGASLEQSLKALYEILESSPAPKGTYGEPILFLSSIKPEKIKEAKRARRHALRKSLEAVIKKLLEATEFEPQRLLPKGKRQRLTEPEKEYLAIRGRLVELDPEIKEFIKEQGGVPGGVLVKGADLGAQMPCISIRDLLEEKEAEETATTEGGIKYDEWDFRRGDYRKNWCRLFETEVHPSTEPFVEQTIRRYGGYVNILRKKFELLRREPKLTKRRKDGEDIDLDALVEAFADMRAGVSPAENLFVKYDRTERNIAVLFLVDMSGSTKGWINEAEKESLVLMCEALESLGDRYAIYGFSGMTRNRCDFFVIKKFDEPYNNKVKSRIAGITPKDYTRMGPAIRHSVRILGSVEAKTKLLITLSDGKPEDYDAYKGDHGIEDTRHALIEAKEQGIHSFCITIDKEASSYLPYMYGEVNYTFIDDVRKLPSKITEIYRKLTT